MLRFSALFCATAGVSRTANTAIPTVPFVQKLDMLSSWVIFLNFLSAAPRPRTAAFVTPIGTSRRLFRHIADRLDFQPAVHRGAPCLDASPRGQGVASRKIRAVDPIELLGVAL